MCWNKFLQLCILFHQNFLTSLSFIDLEEKDWKHIVSVRKGEYACDYSIFFLLHMVFHFLLSLQMLLI